MALVDVKNVSNQLVTLRLNSGRTLILEPGVSSEMVEQEVRGNTKVDKLSGQGVIAVLAKGKQGTDKAEKKTPPPKAS